MTAAEQPGDTSNDVLAAVRRRGQFLLGAVLWACAAGLLILLCGYLAIVYHYSLSLADRIRSGLGWHPPAAGIDWFIIGFLLSIPLLGLAILVALWIWYRRIWNRRLREVWPDSRERDRHSRWRKLQPQASESERSARLDYLIALSDQSSGHNYTALAEEMLTDIEPGIAERALTTGLIVGISRSRFLDLATIVLATLELQLHVLTRLGKRPSFHAWKLLVQRCGASLFINSYLNRHDALLLNLMIKKAGMGLHATGDVVQEGAAYLSDQDLDFDDALNLPHGGILGMATKSLEMGAFMALTVGQVGLHALGTLIESVGDELAQGALAAAIIYFHGISLAADTLALDQRHRASLAMNRNFREAVWRMGEVAGGILLDFVRQRRDAFREKRRRAMKTLPRTAYEGIQNLFGRKASRAG